MRFNLKRKCSRAVLSRGVHVFFRRLLPKAGPTHTKTWSELWMRLELFKGSHGQKHLHVLRWRVESEWSTLSIIPINTKVVMSFSQTQCSVSCTQSKVCLSTSWPKMWGNMWAIESRWRRALIDHRKGNKTWL